jgi:nitrogen PTS system EIIA component
MDVSPHRERTGASAPRPVVMAQDGNKHTAPDLRPAPLDIASWLEPKKIVPDAEVIDRRQALELAAEDIGSLHGLDPKPILDALWRREMVGSTALGCGVAIPHARIDGIERPIMRFMRLKWAIDFGAPDEKPVDQLLVILVPSGGDTAIHLRLLAVVAQLFSDATFRGRVGAARHSAEAATIFADWARANCTADLGPSGR